MKRWTMRNIVGTPTGHAGRGLVLEQDVEKERRVSRRRTRDRARRIRVRRRSVAFIESRMGQARPAA
jgi:hypothetical protein